NTTPFASVFHDPTSSSASAAVSRRGSILYLTSAHAQGNARGTWTVTAPLSASRPEPDRRPASPGSAGN
ncbi:hypothetical protein, partial [Nocardioides sp.]|uniref:hypothetical protein n=1 Tax=Nocardioides sp. TaxID=35761 RepID=UPI0027373817